jgi:hypothetical protein
VGTLNCRGTLPMWRVESFVVNVVGGIFSRIFRGLSINEHLHYPNDVDRSLNETGSDNIRKYHDDYNTNPPNDISFIHVITSMSGKLHNKFVRLLFLQDHRETDRFLSVSGVQLA